jgi:glutamine amidotransferase
MIGIIDYEAGNLTSVQRALTSLGVKSVITGDKQILARAEKIIFPGVGAAGKAMAGLIRLGLDQAILDAYQKGTPILGICLGTQIIMEHSDENDTPCLGLIKGKVHRFQEGMIGEDGRVLKIPHMGWNRIEMRQSHPVFEGLDRTSEFYFVHAYYPEPTDPKNLLAETTHGKRFASALVSHNLLALQFHLEKSGKPGLRVLSNFCRWNGNHRAQ